MTDLPKAVAEYFAREKEAMKTMEGADHAAIIEEVAHEFGVISEELSMAVIDETVSLRRAG